MVAVSKPYWQLAMAMARQMRMHFQFARMGVTLALLIAMVPDIPADSNLDAKVRLKHAAPALLFLERSWERLNINEWLSSGVGKIKLDKTISNGR